MLRLALPERISISKVFLVATALMLVQLYQGTGFGFVLLFFGFTILSAYSFNLAGGFSRVIGAYIFWFALLVPYIGVLWKSVLGEAADSNLRAPLLTISAYSASMAMLALVAVITARVDFRPIGISARAPDLDYKLAAMGCMVFWFIVYIIGGFYQYLFPALYSILRQIDLFRQLAIILGTIAVIRESGGRKSVSGVTLLAMLWLMWDGMLSASKQGMLTPFVCWLVAATYARLRLNVARTVAMAIVTLLSFTLFTQMSQARTKIPDGADYGERTAVVLDEIIHYSDLVAFNKQATNEDVSQSVHHYYNTVQNGLIGRLSMMSPDDAFFNYASGVPPVGLEAIVADFQGLVPNFMLSKKKQGLGAGNQYAHLIGGYLAADDNTTGISFSPVPEAYYFAGWAGIFLLLPGIWILFFLSIDFVCGDIKNAPWALLVIVYLGHAAPESLISGLVYYMGYGNFGMFIAILFCTRLAPILGTFIAGSGQLTALPSSTVRPKGTSPLGRPAIQ
jgi:hypothetical protein